MKPEELPFDINDPVQAYDFLTRHFGIQKTAEDSQRAVIVDFAQGKIPANLQELIDKEIITSLDPHDPSLVGILHERAFRTVTEVGLAYLIMRGDKHKAEKANEDGTLGYYSRMSRKEQLLYFIQQYV